MTRSNINDSEKSILIDVNSKLFDLKEVFIPPPYFPFLILLTVSDIADSQIRRRIFTVGERSQMMCVCV